MKYYEVTQTITIKNWICAEDEEDAKNQFTHDSEYAVYGDRKVKRISWSKFKEGYENF